MQLSKSLTPMLLFALLTVELTDRPDGKIVAEAASMQIRATSAQPYTSTGETPIKLPELKMDIRHIEKSNRYAVDGDSYYHHKQERLLYALTHNNL